MNLRPPAAISAALLILTVSLAPAFAQGTPPKDWPAEKCARYRKASVEAIARQGAKGLGQEFLDRHAAFLASACEGERNVCPRSPEELNLANTLVILSMNQGMASTFAPFACRK